MRRTILAALFAGTVAFSGLGCGVDSDAEGSLSESALKGGKNAADGGACKCPKGKPDGGRGKSDLDHGKPDGGRGKSDLDHGKPDGGNGKSDLDHGKPDDAAGDEEDALTDEDELDDEGLGALKKYPDAGAKKGKPSADCSC
ncbi:MAG: hypothetical protein ABW352_05845 [Polyangiales bacterium]